MNILFIGEHILSSGQKVTWEAARVLAGEHKVYVFTNPLSSNDMEHEVVDGIEVYRDPVWAKNTFVGSIKLFFVLYRLLREKEIDVMYVLSYRWLLVAKAAASMNKAPIIAHLGSFITEEYAEFMSSYKFHVNRFLQSTFLRFLTDRDYVWSPSEFTKKRIEDFTGARVVVIPTFIDMDKISNAKNNDVDVVRSELGVGKDFFILFVGRLVPVKNIGNFIKSLTQLKRNYKFFLVGDGPQRDELEVLVEELGLSESVRFLGPKGHLETLSIMNSCDVLVLPSLMDQFPNVVIEALSLGKPVIASNVGGIPEINSKNLYLVNDLKEITDLLEKRVEEVEDEGILQSYSKSGFDARVKQMFEEAGMKK